MMLLLRLESRWRRRVSWVCRQNEGDGAGAYGISGVDIPDVGVGGETRAVGVGEREGTGAAVVSIWEVVSVIVVVAVLLLVWGVG